VGLLGLLQLAFGTYAYADDRDASDFLLDAPWAVLTLLAAGLLAARRTGAALVLLVCSLVLAVAAVPVYLLGLVHLPQAALALAVGLVARRVRTEGL
jgi:hypothetical protein